MFIHDLRNRLKDVISVEYNLYAIIDPVLWPDIDKEIQNNSMDWITMGKGQLSVDVLDVLPRIVSLTKDNDFTNNLSTRLHETGVIFAAPKNIDLSQLVTHFWSISQAKLSNGENVWLRFYEPYVLQSCLAALNTTNIRKLYGAHILMFALQKYDSMNLEYFLCDDMSDNSKGPLVIDEKALEYFAVEHYNLFLHELTRHILYTYYPNASAEQVEKIQNQIPQTAAVARDCGIVTNVGITKFITMAATHGWTFYQNQFAVTILDNAHTSANTKLKELEICMSTVNKSSVYPS